MRTAQWRIEGCLSRPSSSPSSFTVTCQQILRPTIATYHLAQHTKCVSYDLCPPELGSSSPSSDTPPPPTRSPDTLTIPPVPRRYTLRDQSCAVSAAGREERPVLEELDVLHHASPRPAAAEGPGTEAQLDASAAWRPIHWDAAVFAVMTGFVLPTAHLVACG